MEQGAGEGEEVLDFWAGFERLNVDGAVGDRGPLGCSTGAQGEMQGLPVALLRIKMTARGCWVPFELRDDLVEMVAGADKDSDLPGLSSVGGEWSGLPLLDDRADNGGVRFVLTLCISGETGSVGVREDVRVPDPSGCC